jgi:hypothetical protein
VEVCQVSESARQPGKLCLSREEVRELTRTPILARQVDFLRRNGIRHYLDPHGRPVVLRSAVEGDSAPAKPQGWSPNKAA